MLRFYFWKRDFRLKEILDGSEVICYSNKGLYFHTGIYGFSFLLNFRECFQIKVRLHKDAASMHFEVSLRQTTINTINLLV